MATTVPNSDEVPPNSKKLSAPVAIPSTTAAPTNTTAAPPTTTTATPTAAPTATTTTSATATTPTPLAGQIPPRGSQPQRGPQSPGFINAEIGHRKLQKFYEVFCITAALQGRFAYLLMSVHAVNPNIFKEITSFDPHQYLFTNMLYGIGVFLYSRPHMKVISTFNRVSFSILGTLMFNHASMVYYSWLVQQLSTRPYLLTIMGFLSGRIMMLHLLAFLYHVDSRYRGHHNRQPQTDYEAMYR